MYTMHEISRHIYRNIYLTLFKKQKENRTLLLSSKSIVCSTKMCSIYRFQGKCCIKMKVLLEKTQSLTLN